MWRWGRIFFLMLGVAALGVYYIYVDFQGKEKTAELVESKRILTMPGSTEIIGLKFTNRDGETFEIKKEDGCWWLASPVRYPAEEYIVDGLIAALMKTTWDRRFTSGSIDLGEAGLREPMQRIGISFKNSDGVLERTLLLGEGTKTSHKIYAMWGDEAYVFMVHEQFGRALDKSVFSLRKKKIFESNSDDLYSIQIVIDGEDLTLVAGNNKWYRIWRNSQEVAKEKVDSLWEQLATLYAKEFLDDLNPGNPDLGLSSPKNFITVTKRSGESQTLWVGGENKEKEGVYGLKDGEKSVLLLNDVLFRQVVEGAKSFGGASVQEEAKSVTAGLSREAAPEGPSEKEEIQAEVPDISSGETGEDEVRIESAEVAAGRAQEIPLEPVDLKEIGRHEAKPAGRSSEIQVKPEMAEKTPGPKSAEPALPKKQTSLSDVVEITPGKPADADSKPEPAGEVKLEVRKEKIETPAKVMPEIQKEIKAASGPAKDWAARIRGLSMKKLGTEVNLLKSDHWRFEAGDVMNPGKLDSVVGELVNCLGGVKWETRVEDSRKPRVPYAITVKVSLTDGGREQFVFYKTRGEILAEASSREGLYSVPAEVWSELERHLGDILTCKNFRPQTVS